MRMPKKPLVLLQKDCLLSFFFHKGWKSRKKSHFTVFLAGKFKYAFFGHFQPLWIFALHRHSVLGDNHHAICCCRNSEQQPCDNHHAPQIFFLKRCGGASYYQRHSHNAIQAAGGHFKAGAPFDFKALRVQCLGLWEIYGYSFFIALLLTVFENQSKKSHFNKVASVASIVYFVAKAKIHFEKKSGFFWQRENSYRLF